MRSHAAARTLPLVVVGLLFATLGHTFGAEYLDFLARRNLASGYFLSGGANDAYQTIDWDDFVYFPRSIAVSHGHLPLDPWVAEPSGFGWGPFPILPPLIFGGLLALSRDPNVALYIAVVLSTIVCGLMLVSFLTEPWLGASLPEAIAGALVIIKMPWLAVRLLTPTLRLSGAYSWWRFLAAPPVDEFSSVEAGLFTYAAFLLFFLIFCRFVRTGRGAVVTGATAGFLTYFYYYHQVFAFALLGGLLLVAAVERNWPFARTVFLAIAVGLLCASAHYLQLYVVSSRFDLVQYIQRLGYEPGRSPALNFKWYSLAVPLVIYAAVAAVVKRADHTKRTLLTLWVVLLIAYACVLNLRVLLGFDMNSDHYWRMSLGLPATVLSVMTAAAILKDWKDRSRAIAWISGAAAIAVLVTVATVAAERYWGSWSPRFFVSNNQFLKSSITPDQKRMTATLDLLRRVVGPDEVLATVEPSVAYHAAVNLHVRLLAPSGMSVRSNREILDRFFMAQYLTGAASLALPRDAGIPRGADFDHPDSEWLFLFVDYSGQAERPYDFPPALRDYGRRQTLESAGALFAERRPRVDAVIGRPGDRDRAFDRIGRFFTIGKVVENGDAWVVRVSRHLDSSGE